MNIPARCKRSTVFASTVRVPRTTENVAVFLACPCLQSLLQLSTKFMRSTDLTHALAYKDYVNVVTFFLALVPEQRIRSIPKVFEW